MNRCYVFCTLYSYSKMGFSREGTIIQEKVKDVHVFLQTEN